MRLPSEFIRLPLTFDAAILAAEVGQFDESDWQPHPQGYKNNSAMPLVSAFGDPHKEETKGPMRPTPALERCPYLRQVLAGLSTPIGRTRLMRIDGNAEAHAHVDTNYYWMQRVRVHVPIVTDPDVQFLCGTKSTHMAAGETWLFDTFRQHNVLNPNPSRRIHLVCDTVGSADLWSLVDRSDDEPRHIAFDPALEPVLNLETVNVPVVMSPWEQESLFAIVEGEIPPGRAADEIRELVKRFMQDWRAIWSAHGDRATGWNEFGKLRGRFDKSLDRYENKLRLPNGIDVVSTIRQMLIHPSINAELAAVVVPDHTATPRKIEKPVFIVGSPRSGTSLLFETLAQSPSVFTVGGESHHILEHHPRTQPAAHGWDSNRLTEVDAVPRVAASLRERFYRELRDRDGKQAEGTVRLLEKTPKNALRIPFLHKIFPDARFIYLYREPRATMSSMLDAWRSGRFVTYPKLPGWKGPKWSLLLVPGWRDLLGKDLADIVAAQWTTTVQMLLDDLEELAPDQWCVASYEKLVNEPQEEIERLCRFAGLDWDRKLTAPLPLSRHTLTPPDSDKMAKNAVALDRITPQTEELAARARDLFARKPARRVRMAGQRALPPGSFRSSHTASLAEILDEIKASLIVTTYQTGRVVLIRRDEKGVNTHLRAFPSPMGVAVGPGTIAIGTQREMWEFRNQPDVGRRLPPEGKHDACYLPRRMHVTGDMRVHEMVYSGGELWVVNTRFSTLCTLDQAHSFVPRWRPSFVTHLAPEDRCHLNGVAVFDGRVKWVTALGESNTAGGWRPQKASGGIVIDVESGEIVLRGLSMPHSPRWYAGRFWFLESGRGTLAYADLATGHVTTVASLPGFTRGLAFAGHYAFVGLSQVRESNTFGGLPLTERLRERLCGVWVVDVRSGNVAGFLKFEKLVQEIFDVQILHGIRYPELLEPTAEVLSGSYAVPPAALAQVAGHAQPAS